MREERTSFSPLANEEEYFKGYSRSLEFLVLLFQDKRMREEPCRVANGEEWQYFENGQLKKHGTLENNYFMTLVEYNEAGDIIEEY